MTTTAATVLRACQAAVPSSSTWARAVWDGKNIVVECRVNRTESLPASLCSAGEWTPIAEWTLDPDSGLWSALSLGRIPKQPPSLVRLTCEEETVSVPVFDERPLRGQGELPFRPKWTRTVAQAMRDELLFEQYGGRVASMTTRMTTSDVDRCWR